jgi:hypothetical protein
VAQLHSKTEEGREEPLSSSLAPRTPSIHPQHPGGSAPRERFEEEEEEDEPSSGRAEEVEGVVSSNRMNVDPPPPPFPRPMFFGLSTPAPPPTTATTPLSAEDPIGDALTTIFHVIAGPRLAEQRSEHTPLASEGWYEFIKQDAHVWMDIPPPHPTKDEEDKLEPAKYLKAALIGGTPTLFGSQGQNQNIYSELLFARPFHAAETRYQHFDHPLDILKNPFDARIERLLLFLGDLGVMGDVYMLRSIPLRQEGLLRRKEDVLDDLDILGKRPQPEPLSLGAYDFQRLLERLTSIQRLESQLTTLEREVTDRLQAARVLLRISPFLKMDREEGEVPSTRLFPQLVGKQAKVDSWIRANRGGPRRRPGEPANPDQHLNVQRGRHRCSHCQMLGHFDKDCTTPHQKCSED